MVSIMIITETFNAVACIKLILIKNVDRAYYGQVTFNNYMFSPFVRTS